jgi:hypothetical protein
MSLEIPSGEEEMASQELREIVEKEDEYTIDFSQLESKYKKVCANTATEQNTKNNNNNL